MTTSLIKATTRTLFFLNLLPTASSFTISNKHLNTQTTLRTATATTTTTTTLQMTTTKIIDSHLHVWASEAESQTYPYEPSQIPPPPLKDVASTSSLLHQMSEAGVTGCLIVQPINHKFDHRYVSDAIQTHPDKMKGMLLHDPSMTTNQALAVLDELVDEKGYVGVRVNPYLPTSSSDDNETSPRLMSDPEGSTLPICQRCGEKKIPVGIMCFQGLNRHFDDVMSLVVSCPNTNFILDHFGFTRLPETTDSDSDSNDSEETFQKLLSLAKYPNVYIKVSATFRIANQVDPHPFTTVRTKRFEPLLQTYGSDRLLFGTDFPFVLEVEEGGGYRGAVDLVKSWMDDEKDRHNVFCGTAEKLFGAWG